MTFPSIEFEAIGTHWSIDILEEMVPERWDVLRTAINSRIEQFDKNYSRFRADSLVTAMSRTPGDYTLPTDTKPMLDLYRELYDMSNGSMTPMIGNTLSDAGYDAQYSFQSKTLRKPLSWDEALRYNFPTLTVRTPVLLDFGAVGKGYLIDIVAALITDVGIRSYCIDAGGDIAYHHERGTPIRVGLEHPDDTSKVVGVVELSNKCMAGSAGNRRKWGDYHHIIDPISLASVKHIQAVWTIADTTLLADAMSTALYFVPADNLKKRYTFEYFIMYPDSTIECSTGFTHEIY